MEKKAECNKKESIIRKKYRHTFMEDVWRLYFICRKDSVESVYQFLNPAGERRDYIHQTLTDVIVVSLAAVKG